ncbi:hypothetical protein ACB092_01G209600 [Castanea dentata]
MASSSSHVITQSITLNLPTINQHVRLDNNNYLIWLSVVRPILRSNDLEGIVDGSEPCPQQFLIDAEGKKTLNPTFTLWTKKDQLMLSWMNVSLSKSVLSTMYGLNLSKDVWSTLANRFASQPHLHVAHL